MLTFEAVNATSPAGPRVRMWLEHAIQMVEADCETASSIGPCGRTSTSSEPRTTSAPPVLGTTYQWGHAGVPIRHGHGDGVRPHTAHSRLRRPLTTLSRPADRYETPASRWLTLRFLLISWVCAHNMNALCVPPAIRYVAHHQATEAARRGCTMTHHDRRNTSVAVVAVVVDDRPIRAQPVVSLVVGSAYLGLAARPCVDVDDRRGRDGIGDMAGRARTADRVRRVDGTRYYSDGSRAAARATLLEKLFGPRRVPMRSR